MRTPKAHLLGLPNQDNILIPLIKPPVEVEPGLASPVVIYSEYGGVDPALLGRLFGETQPFQIACRGQSAFVKAPTRVPGNEEEWKRRSKEAQALARLVGAQTLADHETALNVLRNEPATYPVHISSLGRLISELPDRLANALVELIGMGSILVVIDTHSPELLQEGLNRDSVENLCLRYRVASWDVEEVLERYWPEETDRSDLAEKISVILRQTGGQPRLTDDFIQRCRTRLGDEYVGSDIWCPKPGKVPSLEIVKQVERDLANTPHNDVKIWLQQFDEDGKRDVLRGSHLGMHIAGKISSFDDEDYVPLVDRLTFCAGWLAHLPQRQWGIRSALHAHFLRGSNIIRYL